MACLEQLERAVRSQLNKLCWENAGAVVNCLAQLEVQSADELLRVATLVISKVLAEPYFSELYAELVYGLWSRCRVFPAEGEDAKPRNFGRLLLNSVQAEFEDLLATLEPSPADHRNLPEPLLELEMRRRRERMRALMLFMGHLFLRHLLALKVLSRVVEELIGLDGDPRPWPEEHRIECVCELFCVVGPKLEDNARGEALLDSLSSRLIEINIKYQHLGKPASKRVEYQIFVLLQMRKTGWEDTPDDWQ